jgi:hypothetical protein
MTTTEIALLDPKTGEQLTLDHPTEDLARYLDSVRSLEWELRTQKRLVTEELLARMDKSASWTMHLPGMKVTGQSPAPEESWNGAELREALLRLADEGVITAEAVDAAVETVVSYKPRKAGISALRKLGGPVAEVVDSLRRLDQRDRRVSVTVTP